MFAGGDRSDIAAAVIVCRKRPRLEKTRYIASERPTIRDSWFTDNDLSKHRTNRDEYMVFVQSTRFEITPAILLQPPMRLEAIISLKFGSSLPRRGIAWKPRGT